jgi:hypothetical protein
VQHFDVKSLGSLIRHLVTSFRIMLQSKKEVFLDCIIRQSDKRQYGKKPCLAPPYCILYVTRDVCVMWNIVSRNGKEKKKDYRIARATHSFLQESQKATRSSHTLKTYAFSRSSFSVESADGCRSDLSKIFLQRRVTNSI